MKKSHRKDVIIARIIFACMVVVLIAIIVFGVKAVVKYRADRRQQDQDDFVVTETKVPDVESESDEYTQEPVSDDNDQWIIGDTETEETDSTDDSGENPEDGEAGAGEGDADSVDGAEDTSSDGTDTSDQVLLKAQNSVNIRSGADKTYPVVGGVAEGETVILLEEEDNGWGKIQRNDLTGYVYLEYFLIVDGDAE
jgi:hypothetical protein